MLPELSSEQRLLVLKEAELKFHHAARTITRDGKLITGSTVYPDNNMPTFEEDLEQNHKIIIAGTKLYDLVDPDRLYSRFRPFLREFIRHQEDDEDGLEYCAGYAWQGVTMRLLKEQFGGTHKKRKNDPTYSALSNIINTTAENELSYWWHPEEPLTLSDEDFVREIDVLNSEVIPGLSLDVQSYCAAPELGRRWFSTAMTVFKRAQNEGLFTSQKVRR